jgi:hypothetical protein
LTTLENKSELGLTIEKIKEINPYLGINVFYRIHLRDGLEQIYKAQTVTDEIKTKINGVNNIYKVVPFGYDCSLSNYIVKMIKIPNTDN